MCTDHDAENESVNTDINRPLQNQRLTENELEEGQDTVTGKKSRITDGQR